MLEQLMGQFVHQRARSGRVQQTDLATAADSLRTSQVIGSFDLDTLLSCKSEQGIFQVRVLFLVTPFWTFR